MKASGCFMLLVHDFVIACQTMKPELVRGCIAHLTFFNETGTVKLLEPELNGSGEVVWAVEWIRGSGPELEQRIDAGILQIDYFHEAYLALAVVDDLIRAYQEEQHEFR